MHCKLVLGLAIALTLTSCAAIRRAFEDPSVKPTPVVNCQGQGTRANTCHPGPGGMTICRVTVREQAGAAPIVEPFELVTPGPRPGVTIPSTIIVWQIVGGGKFRDAGDGALIQSPGNEFSGRGPADMNGSALSGESPHSRILFLNSQLGDYKYSLKYRDRSGREVVCDPKINNAGG